MCRIFCEELEIPFHRLSPQVGEMIGTAETDDVKLCDSIIWYAYGQLIFGQGYGYQRASKVVRPWPDSLLCLPFVITELKITAGPLERSCLLSGQICHLSGHK